MQKFKIVVHKVSKFADLSNFLNFPQLILLCLYFKFHEKDTAIGLIGAGWGCIIANLGGDLNPKLRKKIKR